MLESCVYAHINSLSNYFQNEIYDLQMLMNVEMELITVTRTQPVQTQLGHSHVPVIVDTLVTEQAVLVRINSG